MTPVFAAEIGATALYLTYAWLLSAAFAGYLAHRKGYPERYGLAAGLLLNAIGVVIWLVWPARPGSLWKKVGPFGRPKLGDVEAHAARHDKGKPASSDVAPTSGDTTERP